MFTHRSYFHGLHNVKYEGYLFDLYSKTGSRLLGGRNGKVLYLANM